jgi:hypothetical protein
MVLLGIGMTKEPLGWIGPHGTQSLPEHTCFKENWDERLHVIKDAIANQLGLTKYKCPCTWCHAGGKAVLWFIVNTITKIWL